MVCRVCGWSRRSGFVPFSTTQPLPRSLWRRRRKWASGCWMIFARSISSDTGRSGSRVSGTRVIYGMISLDSVVYGAMLILLWRKV